MLFGVQFTKVIIGSGKWIGTIIQIIEGQSINPYKRHTAWRSKIDNQSRSSVTGRASIVRVMELNN